MPVRRRTAAGMTYQEIADELGYANRGTVYRLVQAALTPELQEDVETHRRLGRDRLDALQVDIFLGWQGPCPSPRDRHPQQDPCSAVS